MPLGDTRNPDKSGPVRPATMPDRIPLKPAVNNVAKTVGLNGAPLSEIDIKRIRARKLADAYFVPGASLDELPF